MSRPIALVIEDDRDMASLFAVVLRTAGIEAEIAHAGDIALARLGDLAPDLVLLDLHIPCTPGVDIVREIRADARLSGTCIIVITADPRAAEDIQDDVDLVLIKPVSFDQLHGLVARLVPIASPDERGPHETD
jgi:DNA-binding response OmpR family regulator